MERTLAQLGHSVLSSICVPATEREKEGRREGRKGKR